ncbi:ornithine decarboxylase antizyme 1 [Agrilus planipennis]|uniref:Ornithine decarboxylase antizyme n=1 Tax=Agrilus planipennis TaxID=224129 RepID=A0A1W4X3Q1_AGRPL|nr:ornithine decarboxylase antizyme 1 [Agrilus planipennis]
MWFMGLSIPQPPTVLISLWAPGLCGGPDVSKDEQEDGGGGPPLLRLTFRTARQPWDAVLRGRTLFVALPPDMLPEGSREAFVALLEAAEEQLKCHHVVVVFGKDRVDRATLIRTFMFLGFSILSPTSPLVPPSLAANNVCMLYNIE